MKTRREKAKERDNPPPSLGSPTDPSDTKTEKREGEVLNQVKTEMGSSKLVGKKRRNIQTKKILKKQRKVADMRVETIRLRKEIDKMEAAAKEKKKVVKLEKKKRNRCLTKNLLLSGTEHLLMGILFPPSGNY